MISYSTILDWLKMNMVMSQKTEVIEYADLAP